jgi:hypothetical protein
MTIWAWLATIVVGIIVLVVLVNLAVGVWAFFKIRGAANELLKRDKKP